MTKLPVNILSVLGLIVGSSGLFFLGRVPYAGQIFFLTHPLSEWQLGLMGTSGYASPFFFSVLPVFLISVILYPWKKLATFNVGLAFGMASFLMMECVSPQTGISWIPGRLLESVWLAGNSFICCLVALLSSFRVR